MGATKGMKRLIDLIGCKASAMIANLKFSFTSPGMDDPSQDFSAIAATGDRGCEHMVDGLTNTLNISPDRHAHRAVRRGPRPTDRNICRLCAHRQPLNRDLKNVLKQDRFLVGRNRPVIDRGHLKDRVDMRQQKISRLQNVIEIICGLLAGKIEIFGLFEHFGKADNGIERRAQLVVHVFQKRRAHADRRLSCCPRRPDIALGARTDKRFGHLTKIGGHCRRMQRRWGQDRRFSGHRRSGQSLAENR